MDNSISGSPESSAGLSGGSIKASLRPAKHFSRFYFSQFFEMSATPP